MAEGAESTGSFLLTKQERGHERITIWPISVPVEFIVASFSTWFPLHSQLWMIESSAVTRGTSHAAVLFSQSS